MSRRVADDLPFDPDLGADERGEDRPATPPQRSVRKPHRAQWATLTAVSAGGVLGGSARYGIELALPVRGVGFPWGTFAVNVVGALVLSLVLVLILEAWPPRRYLRPFLAIGFLGSFTTFSTWMLEVHDLAAAGRIGLGAAYLGGSLFAGIAATALGLIIGRAGIRARTGKSLEGT